jgi:hypothetical protein
VTAALVIALVVAVIFAGLASLVAVLAVRSAWERRETIDEMASRAADLRRAAQDARVDANIAKLTQHMACPCPKCERTRDEVEESMRIMDEHLMKEGRRHD